jgi:hypothetical protein
MRSYPFLRSSSYNNTNNTNSSRWWMMMRNHKCRLRDSRVIPLHDVKKGAGELWPGTDGKLVLVVVPVATGVAGTGGVAGAIETVRKGGGDGVGVRVGEVGLGVGGERIRSPRPRRRYNMAMRRGGLRVVRKGIMMIILWRRLGKVVIVMTMVMRTKVVRAQRVRLHRMSQRHQKYMQSGEIGAGLEVLKRYISYLILSYISDT